MFFADRLTLDAKRRTRDGYLVARSKAARSGIYEYLGAEIDPQGTKFAADAIVKVYRPEKEVFDKESVASFLMKPVTNDHPAEPVTADNWRSHAKGVVGQALREGDFLAFDLVLMDKATIDDVDTGKRELSNGYSSDIEFVDGKTDAGDTYQAIQRNIRGNHVAIVDKGRAGPFCRIADAESCESAAANFMAAWIADERTYNGTSGNGKTGTNDAPAGNGETKMPHTLMIDGLQVPNVSDEAKAAIEKLQGQIKDEREGRAADKSAHDKTLATKDAEIDDLKTKVVDQKKIDALADAKAAVVADAKQIAGDKLGETGGKTVAEVRRMACVAVLGDAAVADKSDEYVEARFDTLKDAKPEGSRSDPLRTTIASQPTKVGDTATIRDAARASRYVNA